MAIAERWQTIVERLQIDYMAIAEQWQSDAIGTSAITLAIKRLPHNLPAKNIPNAGK
jgi:hypothetical protein